MDLRIGLSIVTIVSGACLALGAQTSVRMAHGNSSASVAECGGDGCEGGRRALIASRAADGLFRVPVTVNGVPAHAIVDTGANDFVMSRAHARRFGARPLRGPPATVRTAAGRTSMHWMLIDRLDIGEHSLPALRVGVIDADLPAPLLGLDIVTRLGEVTIRRGELFIGEPADKTSR